MEVAASPRQGLFQNRFIRTILLSGIFLQLGIWVRNFAILLFVMDQTNNDPFAVSLISVAQFAPIFLFSFVGGTFADRWRPKRTLVTSDLLSALSILFVLLALVFGSWKAVFFATLVSSILSQFSQPSVMKLFKQHVPEEQLQPGMAMFQTLMAVFMMIGPILGTFVYQFFGIHVSIAVMGVAFLISAGILVSLPPDPVPNAKRNTQAFWQDFADGFRYVWSKPILRSLGAVFALTGLGSGLVQPVYVFLVVEQLGLPKEQLQWLMMVYGAAMLAGSGIIMGAAKKIAPPKILALGLFASAIGTLGNALSTTIWAALACQVINGLFFTCIHIGMNTLILRNSEESYVGRVNGVLTPLFMGMMVIAMSIAGWLKSMLTLPLIFETAALCFFVGVLCLVPFFTTSLAKTEAS